MYADGQRDLAVIETLMHAVRDCAIVEQRGVDLVQRLDEVVEAADVEKSLLLSGERCVGQVFGSRGRADRYGDIMAVGQCFPGLADFFHEPIGQGGLQYPRSNLVPDCRQCVDIVHIEALEGLVDALIELIASQELAIRRRRCREAAGYRHTQTAQITNHFTKRGVLAADDIHIIHAKLGELDDVRLQCLLPCVPVQEMDNRLQTINGTAILNTAAL